MGIQFCMILLRTIQLHCYRVSQNMSTVFCRRQMERLQALLWITQITVTFYNTRIIFCPKIVDFVGSYNEFCCLIAKADFIDRTLQLWPRKQYCRLFFSVIKIWPPRNWIPVYFLSLIDTCADFRIGIICAMLSEEKMLFISFSNETRT